MSNLKEYKKLNSFKKLILKNDNKNLNDILFKIKDSISNDLFTNNLSSPQKKILKKVYNDLFEKTDQEKNKFKLSNHVIEELKRQEEARLIREKMAKQRKKQAKFKEIIVMSFDVAQFGTWNCDSPIKQPKGKTVNATFASLAGAPIVLGAVYLIEKNRNSIFTYDVAQFNNLKFNPKETNTLIGFTLDDEIAIFRSGKFENVKERKHEFKMEIKNAVDMSVEKLKKMILSRQVMKLYTCFLSIKINFK